jgi:hypothetical protein
MAVGFPTKVDYATGDVLSADNMNDLSGTVNLLEGTLFAAGKNKIINGDFSVNQRNFTSTTTTNTYGLDRWALDTADGTATYSVQTFTPGAAPVAGYESTNFARIVTTGQTLTSAFTRLAQPIEDVRTFAGQTVTVSFWAKAATGTPKIAAELAQAMGSGGSGGASNTIGNVTIGTSWARYTVTGSVAGLSGATIGTSSSLILRLFVSAGSVFNARTGSMGIQSNTFDIWGVQVEAGSTASSFQTATGTIQGELAACQRYFWRPVNGTGNYVATGQNYATTNALAVIQYPVTMRRTPSITVSAAAHFSQSDSTAGARVLSAFSADSFTRSTARLTTTCGAFMTAGHATLINSTDALATLDFGAEL